MAKLDVVCFGEILWDIYEEPRSRVAGESIGSAFRRVLGGAPANVAVGLARLGVKSAVVGGVGRDAFGESLNALLVREGVDTRTLLRYPNRTGLTFITRDARGEPRFLFYRDRTADMALRASDMTPAMGNARWVLFGTSTLLDESLREATLELVSIARARSASVVVDLNVRAHLWRSKIDMKHYIKELLQHADLIKASRDDLSAVGGLGWLERAAPGATLLLTAAGEPAQAIGAHGDVQVAAARARCVDATGAGDAFLAGALATLLEHEARPGSATWQSPHVFVRALKVGHILGRKAISKVGAVTGLVNLDGALRGMRR